MSLEEHTDVDFARARRSAFFGRLAGFLSRMRRDLSNFDESGAG